MPAQAFIRKGTQFLTSLGQFKYFLSPSSAIRLRFNRHNDYNLGRGGVRAEARLVALQVERQAFRVLIRIFCRILIRRSAQCKE